MAYSDHPDEYNPNNGDQMAQLWCAMEYSYRKMEPYRRKRFEVVEQFVGQHYSDNGTAYEVPVNLIEMATSIFVQHLAAHNPKVLATTISSRLKNDAAKLELAMNHLLYEIRFVDTIRSCIQDALFGMGIMKTGTAIHSQVEVMGFLHDIGQPYADSVDLDDFVYDMTATRYGQVSLAGNRYKIPYEIAMEMDFDKEARDLLQPTSSSEYEVAFAEDGNERVEELAHDDTGLHAEAYKEWVELWDVWLPYDNQYITIANTGAPAKALFAGDWEGPESGPYDLLRYNRVPNCIYPLPPAAIWRDEHDVVNNLFRKLSDQAERQKTILGYQGDSNEDAERVQQAVDGAGVRMDQPDKVREYRFGGIDPNNLAYAITSRDLFKQHAGNLDQLGGLGPQADTLGQEQMISQQSAVKVTDLESTTEEFTTRVLQKVAWYLYHDPNIEIPLTRPIPGTTISFQTTYTPAEREGDFLEYNVSIEAYSMRHRTPGMKLQAMSQIFQQYVFPLMPQLMAGGTKIDFEALIKTASKFADLNEITDIFTFANPVEEVPIAPPGGGDMPAAANKRTESVRINRPGQTTQGQSESQIGMMMGKGSSEQNAAFGRAVG